MKFLISALLLTLSQHSFSSVMCHDKKSGYYVSIGHDSTYYATVSFNGDSVSGSSSHTKVLKRIKKNNKILQFKTMSGDSISINLADESSYGYVPAEIKLRIKNRVVHWDNAYCGDYKDLLRLVTHD